MPRILFGFSSFLRHGTLFSTATVTCSVVSHHLYYVCRCGHCKRLAPVLAEVAPMTSNQMAIGTIDCTVEKSLCDKYKVRGYPTLKYAVDGDVLDYPGGRDKAELLSFAAKLSGPPLELVASVAAAKAHPGSDGVVFVGYHPATVAVTDSVDAKLQSSRLTTVYAAVARKLRAAGTFLLVDPSDTADDEAAAAAVAEISEGPFICRLEQGVDNRCYFRISDSMEGGLLQEWIVKENQPTVATLGAQNFHKIGKAGKPLVIAAVGPPSQIPAARDALIQFALHGPEPMRTQYNYGTMDAVRWKAFLSQFEVDTKALPHVFILDVPRKKYWTNTTYGMEVDTFMAAVADGTIPVKSAGAKGWRGTLEEGLRLVVEWQPYSLILIVVLIIGGVIMMVRCCMGAARGLRPPYPRKDDKGETKEGEKEAESKKDK